MVLEGRRGFDKKQVTNIKTCVFLPFGVPAGERQYGAFEGDCAQLQKMR